jgi:cyclopropane fatty-acyl-phospholipid synthase-like methyltransferase
VDRRAWIDERREAVRAEYDAEAATYDENPYPAAVQEEWIRRLLATCPEGGTVLDAPCGTGRYFSVVVGSGRRVVGVDQSAGMLEQARARNLAVGLEHVGLQELAHVAQFDAVMTVDAMENVAPEDWPLVLANLHRALLPGGHLYVTVEEQADADIDRAHADLVARGLPVVRGEVVEGDVAGYHYYPSREQVLRWIEAEGLDLVDERYQQEDGWGYRHFLLRSPAAPFEPIRG